LESAEFLFCLPSLTFCFLKNHYTAAPEHGMLIYKYTLIPVKRQSTNSTNSRTSYSPVIKFGDLQKKIRQYQNEVLALAGVGSEFYRVDDIVKEVEMLVHWVEELLCIAMVDAGEVRYMYERQTFTFQEK
jgi:hypothetical protein